MGRLHGAGDQRRVAQRVGAEGDDRHIFVGIETEGTQPDAGCEIAGGTEGADADSLAFERSGVGNVWPRHQRVQHAREVEAEISYREAEDGAADDGAGAVAVVDVAGKQRLDSQIGTQRDINQVNAFVAVKAALDAVKQWADRQRGARGMADDNFLLRRGDRKGRNEQNYDDDSRRKFHGSPGFINFILGLQSWA